MIKKIAILIIGMFVAFGTMQAQEWNEIYKALPIPSDYDKTDERFGYSVSVDGNYAVVGAYKSEIAVVLYNNEGLWETVATLRASDQKDGKNFGYSVSISNDNIVVGAKLGDGIVTGTGLVYVFTKPVGGWVDMTESAKLTASDGANSDYFGGSVSICGDNIVIGACEAANHVGAAYVFTKPVEGWNSMTETAKLTASDGEYADQFGISVNISGDNVVVGAYQDDDNETNSGSAYVYTKPASGWSNMNETAKLTASDGANGNCFGYSVSISCDNIVIGAYAGDGNDLVSGTAYVYKKPVEGWSSMTETAKLTASDGAGYDRFGYSVSISLDNIIVGAYRDDDNGSASGSAYVYTKPIDGWASMTQTAKLTASDGAAGDAFGYAICVSGDNIIAGVYADDDNGAESGSVYLFTKPGTGWETMTETQKKINDISGNKNDQTGYSVSIDGNYAVIGAFKNNMSRGCVYVLYNNANTWENIATLTASDGIYLGYSVCISGDNIVAGASIGDNIGSAYVFTKPLSGWTSMTETAKLTASDGATSDQFGGSVSISCDNIVIGAYGDDDAGSASGSAYIFTKPLNGWTTMTETAKLTASDRTATDQFGYSVSISGDNVLVGARYEDGNGYNYGAAYVFSKPTDGWINMTETAKLTASDKDNSDLFGYSVSIDGENIVVGAPGDADNGYNTGSAYVFTKPGSGWSDMTETAKLTASDGASYDWFGHSVSLSNDNIVIGAYRDGDNGVGSGSAYIFKKSVSGWATMTETAKLTASDGVSYDWFGYSVSISGNNIVVGTPQDRASGLFSGSAYVFKNETITDVSKLNKNELFTIYPNPTNGIVNFEFAENNIQKLTVSDITGKQIIEKTERQQKEKIDLSGFDSGIYIIKIQTDNEIFTTKIIKE